MGAARKLRRKNKYQQILDRIDREVDRYKERLYDNFLSVYVVNVALAVYDCYGNQPKRIQRVVEAFNRRIADEASLAEAQAELYDKTGIRFTITE